MAAGVDLTRHEARQLVERIARGLGYIPAETLAAMDQEMRVVVVEALRAKDGLIASSVSTYGRFPTSSSPAEKLTLA
jgi:hypothetical protein